MIDILDVIIIGSGPAGYTAGVYAARAGHNSTLISGAQLGGQLTITTDIENFPGFPAKITGPELMDRMKEQCENAGVNLVIDSVSKVDFSKSPFHLFCESGQEYFSKSVIIATGASAKWLGLESEARYRGKGVSACATCDGFFFRKKVVAVVGGGNSAVEEALYLSGLADSVYLICRKSELKAEKIQQERLFAKKNINILWGKETVEILGNGIKVTGIKLRDTVTREISELELDGVFIAIGHAPNSDIFRGILDIDEYGYIVTNSWSTQTSIPGIFAAGDIRDSSYRQAITSAGQGCMAAIEMDKYLSK